MGLPGSWCLHGASSGLLPRGCPAPLCPAEVSASPLSTWACAIWPQSGGPRFCLHLKGLVCARPAWPSRLAKLPPHVPVLPVTLPSGPAWGPSKALPWCLPAPGTNCLSLSDRSAAGCSQQPLARHLWWAGEAGCHAQRGLRRVASPCLGRETRGAMRHPQWRGGSEEAAAHHGPHHGRAWQSCGVHPISCVKAPDTADSEAPAPSSAALPPAQPGREGARGGPSVCPTAARRPHPSQGRRAVGRVGAGRVALGHIAVPTGCGGGRGYGRKGSGRRSTPRGTRWGSGSGSGQARESRHGHEQRGCRGLRGCLRGTWTLGSRTPRQAALHCRFGGPRQSWGAL